MTDKLQETAEDRPFRSGPPPRRTPLRDNLESIVIAVLLVLFVRQMVVEAFRIRHGSMAPTLVGDHLEVRCPNCAWTFDVGQDKARRRNGEVECSNCGYRWEGASPYGPQGQLLRFRWPAWLWNNAIGGGQEVSGTQAANRIPRNAARIFVNKFVYHFREPRRWEVVVFVFPRFEARCPICDWTGEVQDLNALCPDCGSDDLIVEARNYIKRVVGLPGETISLRDGDVYVDGRILRKPRTVQDGLWLHVFDSRFMPQREVLPLWDLRSDPGAWVRNPPGGVLRLDALDTNRPVMGVFGRQIMDFYPYDGLSFRAGGPLSLSGRHPVGDVRIRARIKLQEAKDGGAVHLAISDRGRRFALSVGTGSNAQAELLEDGVSVMRSPVRGMQPGESRQMELQNYDDRIVARLDGREILSYEYSGGHANDRGIEFGGRSVRALWERIQVDRDIYYSATDEFPEGYEHTLGDGRYFVLGDNSPASSDSRRWDEPGIAGGSIIGKASFVFWPFHKMRFLARPSGTKGEGAGTQTSG